MRYGFEIYESSNGKWRWRLWGEVLTIKNIASSAQSWPDKETAIAQAKMVRTCPDDTEINILNEDMHMEEETNESFTWLKIKEEGIRLGANSYGYTFGTIIRARLEEANIVFLSDLEGVSEIALLKIIGHKRYVNELKEFLSEFGLSLAPNESPDNML